VKDYEENGPKLSIFDERNHGALLQIWAADATRRNMISEILSRPQRCFAGYFPPRSTLRCGSFFFGYEHGKGIFKYDKPSSLLSQYNDARATEVGRNLDTAPEGVLCNAAA